MRAVPVSPHVTWVGAVDWNLRDFHGFETPRGSTYNAYLVRGSEQTALVDTVKTSFVPELLSRIAEVMDPADIDVIVVNHVEPDHNSGLRDVIAACPKARVVASGSGVRGVAEYHDGLQVEAVGADDVIDLGSATLRFLPAPMVHWPDSMFTYCAEDSVLMCNDAFGQHLASAERFADEVGVDLAVFEAGAYYANILLDLGPQILKIRHKVTEAGWNCGTIAPSHGVIWRGDAVAAILGAYDVWNNNQVRDKVVVAYGTMWGSTDQLAHVIADALIVEGVDVDVFDLGVTAYATVMHAILDARGVLVGSPTLHRLMLPKVAGFMENIAGLKPSGRVGAAFGSYGWSSGATAEIVAQFEKIGMTVAQESYTQKYRPTEEELEAAKAWAASFARTVKDAGMTAPQPAE